MKKDAKGQKDETITQAAAAEQPQTEAGAEQAPPVVLSPEEFEQVKQHIEALQKENQELIGMLQRLQADFDNYRKRNAAIRAESLSEGTRSVMADMLPTLDNFDRALNSFNGESSAWVDGVKMVYRQLMDTLSKNGLQEVPAEGKFDPELHEAVLQEEGEGLEAGDILEVLQKGYMVGERIIRHSMVKVAK